MSGKDRARVKITMSPEPPDQPVETLRYYVQVNDRAPVCTGSGTVGKDAAGHLLAYHLGQGDLVRTLQRTMTLGGWEEVDLGHDSVEVTLVSATGEEWTMRHQAEGTS